MTNWCDWFSTDFEQYEIHFSTNHIFILLYYPNGLYVYSILCIINYGIIPFYSKNVAIIMIIHSCLWYCVKEFTMILWSALANRFSLNFIVFSYIYIIYIIYILHTRVALFIGEVCSRERPYGFGGMYISKRCASLKGVRKAVVKVRKHGCCSIFYVCI